jgi:hypothetical protein
MPQSHPPQRSRTRKPKRKVFLSRSGGPYVYWTLRSSDPGEMRYGRVTRRAYRVIENFGRFPTDPQQQAGFLARVRIALRRYGIMDIPPMNPKR